MTMRILVPYFPRVLALWLAACLAACSSPDEAALAKGDAALAGQTVDGVVHPVASRSVMVGTGERAANACAAVAQPAADKVTVHWSNDSSPPPKAEYAGEMWSCQSDGDWTGIVFPATGQSMGDCNVDAPLRRQREYQGPCRWGWVRTTEVRAGS